VRKEKYGYVSVDLRVFGYKKQAWFLLNPFLMSEDVSIGGNGICFVI
jgi:hypothetical protein